MDPELIKQIMPDPSAHKQNSDLDSSLNPNYGGDFDNIPEEALPHHPGKDVDMFDGHVEKLEEEYRHHRDNFDPIVFLIGFILFCVIYKCMSGYGLIGSWDDDDENEQRKNKQGKKDKLKMDTNSD